jgi:hypothetical protein
LERSFARAHLGNQDSQAAAVLRTRIANGARVGLEKQYLEFVDATIQRDPANAAIGGDPSISNRIMGYLRCVFYRGGRWDEDLEVRRGAITISFILNPAPVPAWKALMGSYILFNTHRASSRGFGRCKRISRCIRAQ